MMPWIVESALLPSLLPFPGPSSPGKLTLLQQLLPRLLARGHRVLIFSQFVEVKLNYSRELPWLTIMAVRKGAPAALAGHSRPPSSGSGSGEPSKHSCVALLICPCPLQRHPRID